LEFEIFFIWRFILPRPGKRLRKEAEVEKGRKGKRRKPA